MRTLIKGTVHHRLIILVLAIGVLVAGAYSYLKLPVDAFPDVTPALVQVFTETEGLAPEEVERYVTYPIEVAMNGLPDLKEIRSVSNFGLSVVNIYFEDGTDIYFARNLVNERLQLARDEIPAGFGEPEMGPISTGLGQILFYFVEDETGRSPEEMREIQDWIIKFNLQTVPGVTEVLSLGGEVKQFQIQVEPTALLRYGLSIGDVVNAVEINNGNVGAQYIVKNAEQYLVRSVGLAQNIKDLEDVILKVHDGVPVRVRDVARVTIGGEVRQGLATLNGKGEAVAGLVLKLIGTNTSQVIEDTKARLAKISETLPPGVRVVPYYDQSKIVAASVHTVTKALFEGIGLVALVILAFMGGLRPSLVVALAIPFSIAVTFILMSALGVSANLMSLGGIAIAIGLLVDGAIVMVENVDRWLHQGREGESKRDLVVGACAEVARPIAFAIIIIVVVFLPLFTLQGVEGKTFRPLAITTSLAMLGSLVFAIFVAPVLSEFFLKQKTGHREREHKDFAQRIISGLLWGYRPLVGFFVRRPFVAVGLAGGMLAIGLMIFPLLGSEFVPRLNEGDLLVRVTMAPSISLEESRDTVLRFERKLIAEFPEVERVVSRVGRGEVGAHADPVNNAESFVALRPPEEWPVRRTPAELYAAMSEAFEDFPGAQFNFTQPIAAAVDELLTGTKAELAIKLFGPDTEVLKAKAAEIDRLVRGMKGAADVQMDQVSGTPQLRIVVDRDAISRYGININDVQSVIRTAVGGEEAGQIFEGVKRFDIVVRFTEAARATAEAIRAIVVRNSEGALIPLEQIAAVEEIVGPRQITREDGQRFITIQTNVRGRDIGSFVAEGQRLIADKVSLPPGYFVEWGGQFELQEQANQRLMIVVPVTLALAFFLLFMNFDSVKTSTLIMLNIPLALVGGVVALWLAGLNLSVPASVGFIALFGIALGNGMVLVTYIDSLVEEGLPIDRASIEGACVRVRPVLMTATCAALGLIPLLYATGTGSEVQRPLATVVIGGLVTSTVLTLLVLPALYRWFVPGHLRSLAMERRGLPDVAPAE